MLGILVVAAVTSRIFLNTVGILQDEVNTYGTDDALATVDRTAGVDDPTVTSVSVPVITSKSNRYLGVKKRPSYSQS